MTSLPPGLVLISRSLHILVFPPALTYAILRLLNDCLNISLSLPLVIVTYITTPIVLVLLTQKVQAINRAVRAYRMGAQPPPRLELGGFAVLKAVGNSFKFGYIGDIFQEWLDRYGQTFSLYLGIEYRIFTTEPSHVKAILATQFEEFVKGPHLHDQSFSLLGSGVFNTDGDMWKFHRTMTRPFFSKDRISTFDVFEKHADATLNVMKSRLEEGYPIDFQDAVARFTLDSATEFLLGKDARSLDAGLGYPESSGRPNPSSFVSHPSNKFVQAFVKGQELVTRRSRYGPLWRLTEFWKDDVEPPRAAINEYIDPVIAEAIAQKRARGGEKLPAEDETLLSHLVEATEDYSIVQDELINIFVAGRDTTAGTLTFALYALTQNPHIVQRLRHEILETVGPTRGPAYDDIRSMKYLRAFLNEVLRLYPVVPFDSRSPNKDTTLPNPDWAGKPFFVPADTKCTYSVFLMHRRTDLWGPDASIFDPDRFLDERLRKYLTPNPYIFVPFSAGPRICLGQQFAYNEASFFLIRLLQRFTEFSLDGDAQPAYSKPRPEWAGLPGTKGTDKISLTTSLTMFAKGGLWVRMKELASETDVCQNR